MKFYALNKHSLQTSSKLLYPQKFLSGWSSLTNSATLPKAAQDLEFSVQFYWGTRTWLRNISAKFSCLTTLKTYTIIIKTAAMWQWHRHSGMWKSLQKQKKRNIRVNKWRSTRKLTHQIKINARKISKRLATQIEWRINVAAIWS